MASPLPARTHKFAFGLWTVGNRGGDPFGEPVRAPLDPVESVRRLGALGAHGVSFHDDDLIPPDATAAERDRIVRGFRAALDEAGMVVTMATTNLFVDPVFRDGAFTSNDPAVRRYAVAKVMRNLDLAAQLGAGVYVFWGGREGVESLAAKDPRLAALVPKPRVNLTRFHGVSAPNSAHLLPVSRKRVILGMSAKRWVAVTSPADG